MLLNREVLERIARGEVSLAFRRWRRPTVKPGGTLRTAIGVLAIHRVDEIAPEQLTDGDARRAGYPDLASLSAELHGRPGRLYRIELGYLGGDLRIALRAHDALEPDELEEIAARLDRFDRLRPAAWTRDVLSWIDAHPARPATELAAALGLEKEPLKRDVRRLKELGLTESLQPGYRLSPRGRAVLAHLLTLRGK